MRVLEIMSVTSSQSFRMFKNSISLIIAFILLSKWVSTADINDKFREEEIIPDIIDDLTDELLPLNVTYSTSGVNLGNVLKPSQVTVAPEVSWEADDGAFYTLLMTGKFRNEFFLFR